MFYTFNGRELLTHTASDIVLAREPMSLAEFVAMARDFGAVFPGSGIRVTLATMPVPAVKVASAVSGTVQL